ncbi:hypothetical protein ACVC7V_26075 [Hydrogenophaga sp. A37]|uniref:hypothetical protein n=1 Tax=Hydrogenophaga sp. A37 TaxID=1945864 RepID=UPI00117B68D7|nr:hypothetical protein [Hydrogenophaga sp. A37]
MKSLRGVVEKRLASGARHGVSVDTDGLMRPSQMPLIGSPGRSVLSTTAKSCVKGPKQTIARKISRVFSALCQKWSKHPRWISSVHEVFNDSLIFNVRSWAGWV